MNVLLTSKMIFSFTEGWDDLIRVHPSILKLFASLVLPLSVLPPVMIDYAGRHYGDVFVPGITGTQWHQAAEFFFIAELLSVPVTAWLVHGVCKMTSVQTRYHTCFTLASVAPVPMWLSSLTLLIPNLPLAMVVGILGLLASVSLIYRGVYVLFDMREDLKAMQMATVIASAGLFMWLILMQIVLVH